MLTHVTFERQRGQFFGQRQQRKVGFQAWQRARAVTNSNSEALVVSLTGVLLSPQMTVVHEKHVNNASLERIGHAAAEHQKKSSVTPTRSSVLHNARLEAVHVNFDHCHFADLLAGNVLQHKR